jgi:inhibitor of KinA sporulation pathway (predicted exonuclease)
MTSEPISLTTDWQVNNNRLLDFIIVVDFECTCKFNVPSFAHEIIEFPAILMDMRFGEVVGQFHSFVRPTENVTLDPFCQQLTGITQENVDQSSTLPKVLDRFDRWLRKRIFPNALIAFACDGVNDMTQFLHGECRRKGIYKAPYFRNWINTQLLARQLFNLDKHPTLKETLALMQLPFVGRHHSGIDDARNLANIIANLFQRGLYYTVSLVATTGSGPFVYQPPLFPVVFYTYNKRVHRPVATQQHQRDRQQAATGRTDISFTAASSSDFNRASETPWWRRAQHV